MNRGSLLLLLALIVSYSASGAKTQKIRIATYDILPPYAFRQDDKLTGVYIEIVKEAITKMPGYEVEFEVYPWARAKQMVMKGEIFGILPPYFHAHDWLTQKSPKKAYIWPYSLQLLLQTDIVYCQKDVLKAPRNRFPEDYKGLSFAKFRGDGRAGPKFAKMVENNEIKLTEVDNVRSSIFIFLSKRVDCVVSSRLPFKWWKNKLIAAGELKSSNLDAITEAKIISKNAGYLGYTDINTEQYPYKDDFVQKFDIQIYHMKKSGRIDELISSFTDI